MEIDLKLNPKQKIAWDFLNDKITTEILYGGAAGGGKSFLGCAWLIINCMTYPGTRWVMGRSQLKNLKLTTLVTFFEICGRWGLNSKHFSYNQQSGIIKFYNNSEILLQDLFSYPSDPEFISLGGLEITGFFIDECNQVSEKAKNMLASRIRYKLDDYDLIPKGFMTCNPSKNWVYDEFYKKSKLGELEVYKQFIQALLRDNKHISKHYETQLSKLDEIGRRRLLNGEWEYEVDGALISYDNIINSFKEYKNDIIGDYYITCDVARKGKDKAVIYLWQGLSVIRIYEMNISLTNEIVDLINTIKREFNIDNNKIVVDGDGVGGGVVDYLKGCIDFVNGSKALLGENYQNLKTQCYFKLAELINLNKISIYNYNIDQKNKLTQELSVITRKNIDSDGKLQIINKDDIKSIIGRSPDYSDCLMMRMYFEFKSSFIPFVVKIR